MGASATLKLRRPSSADRGRETMGTASTRYHLPSADCRERMNTGAALKRRRGRSSGEWETENGLADPLQIFYLENALKMGEKIFECVHIFYVYDLSE
ncbi:hypothetical protein ACFX2I_011093 [Malus domestica]